MLRKILVATDGSDNAVRAVQWAAELATASGAQLAILHTLLRDNLPAEWLHMADVEHMVRESDDIPRRVEDVSTSFAQASSGANPLIARQVAGEVGEQILARARQIAKEAGQPTVVTSSRSGDPAVDIIDEATSGGADLIVLGSRGLGLLKGMLLGSVSSKVSHLAKIPVTIIK